MKELLDKNNFSIDTLITGLGSTVLNSIRDPFSIISRDYAILWLNKVMAYIHGKDGKDAVGKICYQYYFERTEPCVDCPLFGVFETGKTTITERSIDLDGVRRWGEVKAYPVFGNDKAVEAAFVLVFDITSRKKESETQKEYVNYLSDQLDSSDGNEHTVALDNGDITISTSLTRREKDVLRLLTEGSTNTQISGLLQISPHTVKSHVINIFNKLGVSDRTQAAVLAIRYNLI